MKLYEVNLAIQDLLAQLDPDPETGEVSASAEDIMEQLHGLAMKRSSILEYLAKIVLDTRADVEAIKSEERRLRERRQYLERRDNRLMDILDRECAGQKTDCGIATVCYRKTTHVDVVDSKKATDWLCVHGHDDCYHTPEPEIRKTEVKKLLQSGEVVPGVELVNSVSCSLR